jgi:hypothetical protein
MSGPRSGHFKSRPYLGSALSGDHGLRLRQELFQQPRARDVVGVHVRVDAVLEGESQVLDELRVPVRGLDDRVDEHGLPRGRVGQQVGVGPRLSLEELPEQEVVREGVLSQRPEGLHGRHGNTGKTENTSNRLGLGPQQMSGESSDEHAHHNELTTHFTTRAEDRRTNRGLLANARTRDVPIDHSTYIADLPVTNKLNIFI